MPLDRRSPGMRPPDEIEDFLKRRAEETVDAEARAAGLGDDFTDLARNVYRRESGRRGDVLSMAKRSTAGAIGPMQLMPGTAGDLGVDPYDFNANIKGGVKYLADQYRAFGGDRAKAAAAYNAGPGAVRKYKGIPPFRETQDYVRAVAPSMNQAVGDGDPEIEAFLSRGRAQPKPQQPTLDPSRRQQLDDMIVNFEALKRQGSPTVAKELADDIKREFGDVMETGVGAGNWPYVKPKIGSGITYDPKKLVPSKPFTPEEAEAQARQVRQKAAAPSTRQPQF